MGKKNGRGKRGRRGKRAIPNVMAVKGLPGKLGSKGEPNGQGVRAEEGEKGNGEMYSSKGDIGPRGPSGLDSTYGEPGPLEPPVVKEGNVSTVTMGKTNARGRRKKQGKHAAIDVVEEKGLPDKLVHKNETDGQGVRAEKSEKGYLLLLVVALGHIYKGLPGLGSVKEEPTPQGSPGTTVEKEEKLSTGTMGKKNAKGRRGKRKLMEPLGLIDRSPALALEHGLQQSGRTVLAFILSILFRGNLDNLEHELRCLLVSNKCYGDTFDNEEQRKLQEDPFSTYDINLLFKLLQIGCGLAPRNDKHWRCPRGNKCWTYVLNGTETLEFLIALVKNMRNSLSHNYNIIPNIEEHFGKLQQLLMTIMTALEERSVELEKDVAIEEKEAIVAKVKDIIVDAMNYQ